MQNASYCIVRQSQSNSMLASWSWGYRRTNCFTVSVARTVELDNLRATACLRADPGGYRRTNCFTVSVARTVELDSLRATACLRADPGGYRRTNCFTVSSCTGVRTVFGRPSVFFLNVDPVARTESIHLKIVFQLGPLVRLRAGNECGRPAEWRLQSLHSWRTSLRLNYVFHQTTPSHYVSSANKRSAALQISIFIDLSCHSNWIA